MKSLRFLLLAFTVSVSTNQTIAQGVLFSKTANWKAVLEQAKQENKLIFVDVNATWCSPCKLLDQQTFRNEQVGAFINEKFISLKVQTDQTVQDDAYTKSWYGEAKTLSSNYQITTLPALLFFDADGALLFRSEGFQSAGKLLNIAKFAADPKLKGMAQKIDAYKNGTKAYANMASMIKVVFYTLRDWKLAKQMARDYFDNYLNKITDTAQVLTKDNINVTYRTRDTLRSSDQIFKMMSAMQPERADSMADDNGITRKIIAYIAEKEELENKLWRKGKVTQANPNWERLQKAIAMKYPQINVEELVYNYRVGNGMLGNRNFYLRTGNYALMNKDINVELEKCWKANDWFGVNMICWYKYAMPVPDKASLETALVWINKAIEMGNKDKFDPMWHPQLRDTKAVLLYKIGRRQEAIKEEEDNIAVVQRYNLANKRSKDQECDDFISTLQKMKASEKTAGVYASDWKLID